MMEIQLNIARIGEQVLRMRLSLSISIWMTTYIFTDKVMEEQQR